MRQNEPVSDTTTLDAVCAGAIEVARAAAEDEWAGMVGEHLEVIAEDDRVVTHKFECTAPGYVGWRWSVTLARAPESDVVTVDEALLIAGPESILAPAWVPWSERVRPGDLGVGDVLPTAADDPRLIAGYTAEGDLEGVEDPGPLHPSEWELGLGRERVLSQYGRDDAADRWIDGDYGPDAPMAKAAPERCSTCGFLVPIGGAFGQAFGVCANLMSPADGNVVSLAYGCGAHSNAVVVAQETVEPDSLVDEVSFDVLDLGHS